MLPITSPPRIVPRVARCCRQVYLTTTAAVNTCLTPVRLSTHSGWNAPEASAARPAVWPTQLSSVSGSLRLTNSVTRTLGSQVLPPSSEARRRTLLLSVPSAEGGVVPGDGDDARPVHRDRRQEGVAPGCFVFPINAGFIADGHRLETN